MNKEIDLHKLYIYQQYYYKFNQIKKQIQREIKLKAQLRSK